MSSQETDAAPVRKDSQELWAPIRVALRVQAIALVALLFTIVFIATAMPAPPRRAGMPVAVRASDLKDLAGAAATLEKVFLGVLILCGAAFTSGVFPLCFAPDVVAARRARWTAFFLVGLLVLCAMAAYVMAFHRLVGSFPPEPISLSETAFYVLLVAMQFAVFVGWVKTLSAISAAFGSRGVNSFANAFIVAAILASLLPWLVRYQTVFPWGADSVELRASQWLSLLVTFGGAILLTWMTMRASRTRQPE